MLSTLSIVVVLSATWTETLPGDSLGSWSPSPCNRLVVVQARPGTSEAAQATFSNLRNSGWCQVVLEGGVALGDLAGLGDAEIGKKVGAIADVALVVRVFEGIPQPYVVLAWIDPKGQVIRNRATPLGTVLSQRKSSVKPKKLEPQRAPIASSSTPAASPDAPAETGATVTTAGGTAPSKPAAEPEVEGPIRHEIRFDPVFVAIHSASTQAGASLAYNFSFSRFVSLKVLGRAVYFTADDFTKYGATVASHERIRYNYTLEAGLEFVNHDWTVSPVLGVLGGIAATSFHVAGQSYPNAGLKPHFTGLVGVRWHIGRHFALSLDFQNLVTDSTATGIGACTASELQTLTTVPPGVRLSSSLGVSAPCGASRLSLDSPQAAREGLEVVRLGITSWHPVIGIGASGLF